MSKRLKGLYTDCDPVDQPEGTYRHAENININDIVGSVVTEEGTINKFTIEDLYGNRYNPIGHVPLPNGDVVLFYPGGILIQKDDGDEFVLLQERNFTAPEISITSQQYIAHDQISFSWLIEDGLSSITAVETRIRPVGGSFGAWQSEGTSLIGSTTYNVSDGVEYEFEVRATNALGDITASGSQTTAPNPVSVSLDQNGTEIDVTFTAPTDDGGTPITKYEYRVNNGVVKRAGTFTGITGGTFTLTGLSDWQAYTVEMRAVNATSPSTWASSGATAVKGLEGAFLNVTPTTGVTPLDVEIEFGATNMSSSSISADLIVENQIVDTITISGQTTSSQTFDLLNVIALGTYTVKFLGLTETFQVTGGPTDPEIANAFLNVSPLSGDQPLTVDISYGADNTGGTGIDTDLIIEGVVEDTLNIPANGSNSTTIQRTFQNAGMYEVNYQNKDRLVTVNVAFVDEFQGEISINGPADDDADPTFDTGEVDVLNRPSQASDTCGSFGNNIFYIEWNNVDYCWKIPNYKPSIIRTILANEVNTNIPGLSANITASGVEFIAGFSENGSSIILKVPTAIEGNGLIFSSYTIFLYGGDDGYTVNEQIDIKIGGSVFATTAPITALESANSIAQKIYDACIAVSSDYTFTLNSNVVTIDTDDNSLTGLVQLDIKNAGFAYSTDDITIV